MQSKTDANLENNTVINNTILYISIKNTAFCTNEYGMNRTYME
jgi:hypothetical protein